MWSGKMQKKSQVSVLTFFLLNVSLGFHVFGVFAPWNHFLLELSSLALVELSAFLFESVELSSFLELSPLNVTDNLRDIMNVWDNKKCLYFNNKFEQSEIEQLTMK